MVAERLRGLPRSLRFLYAGTIATRLGTFVVPYLTLYLTQSRGLSLAVTGQVVATGGAGLLAGNLLGGWLADRAGRKPTLLASLGINALGLAALAWSLPTELAYAIALGVALCGAGMYTPAANALIADLTSDEQRSFAYTVHYLCINVGMATGPLLGGLLAARSYRWLFVGEVAAALVCAVLIAVGVRGRAMPRPRQTASTTRLRSTVAVWRAHPRVLAFCLATFFVIAPLMGMEYALPLLVGRVLERSLTFVGLVYSINAACILLLGFPVERWIRGRDEVTMMIVAAVLWTLGQATMLLAFSLPALLLCTAVWTGGEIVASIVVPTYVSRRVAAEAKGRMLALQDAVRSVAGIVAPISLGAIWDAHGVSRVLLVMTAVPAVGVALYLVARLGRARPTSVVVLGEAR